MRGGKEQRDLKFGDIVIDKDASGEEFIQHVKERQTKTRTGADPNNSKEIKTTAWANDNPNRCPVNTFRIFTSKRPAKMMKPDCPVFFSVNHGSDRQPHLYGLTKNMIKSCPSIKDGRKLTNHSARRHLVQKLQDRVVQNAQIMQISGHRNVQSVNTYSRLNQNQQKSIFKVLSDTEGKIVFDKGKRPKIKIQITVFVLLLLVK
jgi:integrase